MSMKPYPLKFAPVFKPTIWGGDRIARFKGMELSRADIGESWEISAMEGSESVLGNGCYAGATLPELAGRFGAELIGTKVSARFGNRFPLLIKFLDANQDLSLQVHPNEQLARRRHNASGKSEMWYVVDCRPGTRIYAGFSRSLTPKRFRRLVDENNLLPSLGCYDSCPGDVYYLAAGTIHGIGAGNFLVEIQESSDITYRVSDYGRKGADGKPRELHVDQAIEALDFWPNPGIRHTPRPDTDAELVCCPYFNVCRLMVDGSREMDMSGESFMALVCIAGSGSVDTPGCDAVAISQGETVLVPASLPRFTLTGRMTLLTATL